MDIQTKDGILLRGIPDGTPDEAIKARIESIRAGKGTPQAAPAPQGARLENAEFTQTGKFTPSGSKPIALATLAAPELPFSDFATGASGTMRGAANLASKLFQQTTTSDLVAPGNKPGLGDKIWPKSTNSGIPKIVGEFADPLAWTIGGGVLKALPYAQVGGRGVVEGAKALWKNALGGAVTGGTIGALSDDGTAAGGATVGALANTVLPPVFGGVARGVTAAKQALFPTPGAIGVKAAGDKADDVITALMNTKSGVPNVNLHSGQASVPANSAEFAALQKRVTEKDPSGYFGATGIEGQQQQARLAAVQGVGKTPQELKAAELIRQMSAKTNYGAAGKQIVQTDDVVNNLMQRPSMEKVLARAADLAKERGQVFKLQADVPEQVVAGRIVGEGGTPLTSQTIPAQRAKYPVDSLHYVKMAMDDLIKNPERFGIGSSEVAAIGNTQREFVKWLGGKSPAYDRARQVFANQSKPINQMQVGQYLEQKLTNPLETGERAGVYAQALRDAPGTLKRATGQPRYDELGQVLKPQQEQAVRAVGEDLSRNAEYQALAGKGATNLENRIGAPEVPPTGMFQPLLSAARGWVNRGLGTGLEKGLEKTAQLMKDPQAMARAMRNATPQQRAQMAQEISQFLARGITSAGAQQGDKRKAYIDALQEQR